MRLSRNQTDPSISPWLRRWARLTALATLLLVCAGGLVTSHGVGMAVPDWPNTYGYNMFFFPVSQWVGGIFYEHTHRLIASGVGLMTGILALWLYGRRARRFLRWTGLGLLLAGVGTLGFTGSRWADALVLGVAGVTAFAASFVWPGSEPAPRWLQRVGLTAFAAVVLQGVLGGLRVVLFKDQIGIFHATLAQLFFVLVCALALFTSRWWQDAASDPKHAIGRLAVGPTGWEGATAKLARLRWLFLGTCALILIQLILGAAMRHQHAGLAIPDFPLAYGRVWPAMDPASVRAYNQHRLEITAANPITSFQIGLQMAHRLVALAILAAVMLCTRSTTRLLGRRHVQSRLALSWLGLIFCQVLLGAVTIWSNKAADVATGHVLVGALSLALGAILCMVSFRDSILMRRQPNLGTSLDAAAVATWARPSAAGTGA